MTDLTLATEPLVLTAVHNGIATITLNRAKALNALNLEMVRSMATALTAWASDDSIIAVVLRTSSPKALCAGGDIRYFHAAASAGQFEALDSFFAEEYALNLLIATYPKPYIALMQGVVMGGGMGISATAQLRIVTDNSKLAMPETKIGLFPDVGGTHFLAQLKGHLGAYLGLTGTVMDAAAAQFAGLADAYCPQDAVDGLFERLSQQRFVDGQAVLHYLRSECAAFAHASTGKAAPRASHLAAHEAWINAAFAGNDLASIMGALTQAANTDIDNNTSRNAAHAAWASGTLAAMAGCSPLMLHVALKAIRQAKPLTLPQALVAERALMKHCFAHGEPTEGIRALAVDKDHAPKWADASWNAVDAAQLAALFKT
jgi:enoyl-CoA hydratase/carnithine racemase